MNWKVPESFDADTHQFVKQVLHGQRAKSNNMDLNIAQSVTEHMRGY